MSLANLPLVDDDRPIIGMMSVHPMATMTPRLPA
jgi:hypothetical protein